MKKYFFALGLAVASLAAHAADIDGSYACLSVNNRQPSESFEDPFVVTTQPDGSVRIVWTNENDIVVGTRSGNVVPVSDEEGSGRLEFNGNLATLTGTSREGVVMNARCQRGKVIPVDNAIGAYATADGYLPNDVWGGYDALRLVMKIPNVPTSAGCRAQSVWVGALLPNGSWYYYANGWTTADANGNPPPVSSGTVGVWSQQVTSAGMGATLRAIIGTQFYVGYGCSASDMIARGTYARVYTLN